MNRKLFIENYDTLRSLLKYYCEIRPENPYAFDFELTRNQMRKYFRKSIKLYNIVKNDSFCFEDLLDYFCDSLFLNMSKFEMKRYQIEIKNNDWSKDFEYYYNCYNSGTIVEEVLK
jgi:hypothetical protein